MAPKVKPVDRAAIAARVEKASPAPWVQEPDTAAGKVWVRMGHASDLEPNTMPAVESMRKTWDWRRVFQVRSHRDTYRLTRDEVYAQREADAAFAANARQDVPGMLAELEAQDRRIADEENNGRYWSAWAAQHERDKVTALRELAEARAEIEQLKTDAAPTGAIVRAAVDRLNSLQAALPARRTPQAHGAVEVITEIRAILEAAPKDNPVTDPVLRTREQVLEQAVRHLMDHMGYAPEQYTAAPDHSRCEPQGYTDAGPILGHEDENGDSYHPAHDEMDALAALLVEAFDEVLEPWILQRIAAGPTR
jgi:hypothetical protein